jgi:hypothetical protein
MPLQMKAIFAFPIGTARSSQHVLFRDGVRSFLWFSSPQSIWHIVLGIERAAPTGTALLLPILHTSPRRKHPQAITGPQIVATPAKHPDSGRQPRRQVTRMRRARLRGSRARVARSESCRVRYGRACQPPTETQRLDSARLKSPAMDAALSTSLNSARMDLDAMSKSRLCSMESTLSREWPRA